MVPLMVGGVLCGRDVQCGGFVLYGDEVPYHVMAGSHVVVRYHVWYSAMQLVLGYLLLF